MPMKDAHTVDIENEKEWRRYQLKKLESIDKRLSALEITATTLKMRVGVISAVFGALGSGVISLIIAVVTK
jgi:hypothetical protein